MTERLFDPSSGVFGDVLVESARQGVGGEDALDGGVAERAKRSGMGERAVDLVGAVARAQEQDLPGLRAPAARRACAHQPEELGGAVAHVGEGDPELIEVDRRMPLRRRVQTRRVELEPRTARGEFVAGDAAQIGGVHEQLALGDPDRQQVGDVVVGHGVVVAAPGDEAIDAADPIDDARGVVRVSWQRDEMRPLFVEALERCALAPLAVVDDGVEPVGELGPHVIEVAELTAVEE